jgi:hypothetical protein
LELERSDDQKQIQPPKTKTPTPKKTHKKASKKQRISATAKHFPSLDLEAKQLEWRERQSRVDLERLRIRVLRGRDRGGNRGMVGEVVLVVECLKIGEGLIEGREKRREKRREA